MNDQVDVEALIEALIERQGDFADRPPERGGPSRFGISEALARAHGYGGAMRRLPRAEAADIYRRIYWLRTKLDRIARRLPVVAARLFELAVDLGPSVAITFLQRALTALNRNGHDYADLTPDGRAGPMTLQALDDFLAARENHAGEAVLLRALDAMQGERYLRLAERRPANETSTTGSPDVPISGRSDRDSPSTSATSP